jgi:pimeloyl-ACP methyl ester carboxylesterase
VAEDDSVGFAYDPAIARGFETEEGVAPPDLWPLWQALGEKPVLVIRGALSDLLSVETVARMAALHSGPFAHVDVPRRGHAPLLDEPVALAAMEPFLAEHAS